ncbi:MAG TPA: IS1595 family transposase [Terriglobales bacterium]|nr:IS1595 family transposase [Terriglobales bacterium]
MPSPKTLQQAILFYSNPDNCLEYMKAIRWPDGNVCCPTCGRTDVVFLKNQRKWQCKSVHPKRQFSAKVGTIFEDSPIGLDKWLTAVWMICNCKNGVSSYEIARAIGVTQKSAWFMMHRIRLAMQDGSMVKLGGGGREVEADETFIGGKAKFMHLAERKRRITSRGGHNDKTTVFGVMERGGNVRCQVISTTRRHAIQKAVKENVAAESALYTDALGSYRGMENEYAHQVIDHAIAYVNGRVHTNSMENFWSLLKRSIGGTYVSVEPFHLYRYLDEQCFRFNNRKDANRKPLSDLARFNLAMNNIVGKRLTYTELTDKVGQTETF